MRVGGTGKAYSYLDTLEIPIIENTPDEEDLQDSLEAVSQKLTRHPNLFASPGKPYEN
jgi:methylthioribulose-1-phosphate dehydratase